MMENTKQYNTHKKKREQENRVLGVQDFADW